MSLLFSYTGVDPEPWCLELQRHLPGMEIRRFPDLGEPSEIEYAAVWMHPPGDLHRYKNLKAILSFGAGVEHILRDPQLPVDVPIVRLIDDAVVQDMAMHVLHWVVHFHRNYHLYRESQVSERWHRQEPLSPARRRVGILGIGAMGVRAACCLRDFGFSVGGWGRDRVDIENVEFFEGDDTLERFLGRSDILVNLLPKRPRLRTF